MTSSKKTQDPKASASKAEPKMQSDVTPKHAGKDTLGQGADNVAQVAFDRVMEAVPSMQGIAGDVSDYVREHANVDLQGLADDAATFVRRNPATSLAAAAGVGILIGILASKRS